VRAPLTASNWRTLAVLLPLLALPLMGLGMAPLFDLDEGAFTASTTEMFLRHDFLSTWLMGVPRYDKPVLSYWFQAGSVALLGPSAWAFRLPSARCCQSKPNSPFICSPRRRP
jgi:4-amino-4-deoxy-L-arabinose transferase-like glycosyltransferase